MATAYLSDYEKSLLVDSMEEVLDRELETLKERGPTFVDVHRLVQGVLNLQKLQTLLEET